MRNKRIRERSHYEEILKRKSRARVMLYRDELVEIAEAVLAYVAIVCRRLRDQLAAKVLDHMEGPTSALHLTRVTRCLRQLGAEPHTKEVGHGAVYYHRRL